jgi:hypothetical protein
MFKLRTGITVKKKRWSSFFAPMNMRQCYEKLPHVTHHVQFSESWQIIAKIPAFQKLKDERRTIFFLHAIQKTHNVVPHMDICIGWAIHHFLQHHQFVFNRLDS